MAAFIPATYITELILIKNRIQEEYPRSFNHYNKPRWRIKIKTAAQDPNATFTATIIFNMGRIPPLNNFPSSP
jgi:hypothetical protein